MLAPVRLSRHRRSHSPAQNSIVAVREGYASPGPVHHLPPSIHRPPVEPFIGRESLAARRARASVASQISDTRRSPMAGEGLCRVWFFTYRTVLYSPPSLGSRFVVNARSEH